MSHTQGPWKYDIGNSQIEVEETRIPIADICRINDLIDNEGEYLPDADDNAQLIATAPEILETLEDVLKVLEARGMNDATTQRIKEVLKKAKNEN